MLANTKKSEPIQLDVKLHRSNMQTFLRAAEAKLGTQYPRECIQFLRTNDPWKARAYTRNDYVIEGEGIIITANEEAKLKVAFIQDENKSNLNIRRVVLPSICQHLRNALSPEVEQDLVAHRDYAQWSGEAENSQQYGDNPCTLLSMLHDITGRNRYGNNIILKEQDKMKKEHEQCHIQQSPGETPAQFKKKCMDVEAESIMCGLTPLSDLRQVLIFARGLIKGSRAARHFDSLLLRAETTPESFPTTLHQAWESIMILDTITPVKPTQQTSASTPSQNTQQVKSNNNNRPIGNNNFAKKSSFAAVPEREQTIHVASPSLIQYHEYPIHSVMITVPQSQLEENQQSEYDSVRGQREHGSIRQLYGDPDDYDSYSIPSLISSEGSNDDLDELAKMSLPSVPDATEITNRVVRQKRDEDTVVSEVRNESEMFWGTLEWAIFKSAVEERHASPMTIEEEITTRSILSTDVKAAKRPRINPDLFKTMMRTSDFAVKESSYRYVNDELEVQGIGYGLFAKTAISRETPMLVVQGELIPTAEADAMTYPRNQYLIRVDDNRVLDSYHNVRGNTSPLDIAGRANDPTHLYCRMKDRHLKSSDANTDVVIIDEELDDGVIVLMYAISDIQPNEEILWNYKMHRPLRDDEEDDGDPIPPNEGWMRRSDTSTPDEISQDSQSQSLSQPVNTEPDLKLAVSSNVSSVGSSVDAEVVLNNLTQNILYESSSSTTTTKLTSNSLQLDTLLDNQAGISLFKDTSDLTDIRQLKVPFVVKGIEAYAKGIIAKDAGLYGPFGLVAISKEASSNIISVGEMIDRGFTITYTRKDDTFTLGDPSTSTSLLFVRKGRHYALCKETHLFPATYRQTSDNIAGSEQQRASIYPKGTIKRATLARQLQTRLGYIPSKDLASMNIHDSDVTAKDLAVADHIWGPSIPSLKGREVKRSSPPIIPGDLTLIEQAQTIQVDIMFIAGLPFMVGLISPLGFCITQYIRDRKSPQVQKAVNQILTIAKSRQIWITHLITDNEGGVVGMTNDLLNQGIQIAPTAAGEKAHRVERRIRFIKERVRSIIHGLPYNLTALLLIHCVAHATWCTNLHTASDSTSKLSPHEIFTGRRLSAKRDLRHSFGDFVQATVPHPNNTMASRTEGHITLGSTSSLTGGVRMYCIATGELRVRDQFKVVSTPPSVIAYLDKLAKADNMPDIHAEYVEPTNEQLSIIPPPTSIQNFDPTTVHNALTADWRGAVTPQRYKSTRQSKTLMKEGQELSKLNVRFDQTQLMEKRGATQDGDTSENRGDTLGNRGAKSTNNTSTDSQTIPVEIDEYSDDECDERELNASELKIAENMPEHGYWNGVSRTNDNEKETTNAFYPSPTSAITAQEIQQHSVFNITVTRALEELGDEARESISKELKQLWEKRVWTPVDVKKLSSNVRRSIIRSSMFLKQKFDSEGNHDKLKSRLVAGGHMQDKTLYDDLSSPTAALMSVLIVCAIAALEKRKTATVDIGGAYLNADMMTCIIVHMMLDKRMSAMLLEIDESYRKYLTPKGELCVRLDKALYGCVESALMWHKHLTATLKEIGFIQNETDPCLYNMRNSDGLQCTAVAHVDDLLVTCEDENTIQTVMDHLEHKYKTISESRGNRHSYLGMTVDFEVEGECSVAMTGYESFMVKTYNYDKNHPTPALEDLFEVDDTSEKLTEEEMKHFHTYVAKLLYLAKRTRPECLVATSFLCTRVTRSTKQDSAKLDRVMGYLRGTPDRSIILRPGSMGIVPRLYVDASYGVHADGKSHTGSSIIIGDTGAVFNKSCKQSIVTKSSTEAELVAASDALNQLLHARELLKNQKKHQDNNDDDEPYLMPSPFYQDNKSTIALIKVGRATHEKSRHINIRHFWIHGKVMDKSVVVEYMPTELMIANVLTKPLQGEQFRTETAMITGHEASPQPRDAREETQDA